MKLGTITYIGFFGNGFGFMFKKISNIIIWILITILYSFGIYQLTVLIWYHIAREDAFIATISNMIMIVLFVVVEQLENRFALWLKTRCKDTKPNLPTRLLAGYLSGGPSFKVAMYLFYIVIIIYYALYSANPEFFSYPIGAYLSSVYYGILFLIAADKFTTQIVKEYKKKNKE